MRFDPKTWRHTSTCCGGHLGTLTQGRVTKVPARNTPVMPRHTEPARVQGRPLPPASQVWQPRMYCIKVWLPVVSRWIVYGTKCWCYESKEIPHFSIMLLSSGIRCVHIHLLSEIRSSPEAPRTPAKYGEINKFFIFNITYLLLLLFCRSPESILK